jgi:MFS family permease
VYVLLLPFFLIDILRQPEALAGLVLTAEPALSIFTGPIGGRLSDRFGSKVLVLIGLGTTGIGLWALGGLSLHSSLWDATWRVAVIGMGFGLFYTPNNSALIGAAPVGRLGVATGIAEVASNLGMAAGIAVGSALVAGAGGGPMVSGPEFAADFGVAMRVSASVCLIAMIIGMLWMRTSGPKRYDPRNPSQQLRDQSAG